MKNIDIVEKFNIELYEKLGEEFYCEYPIRLVFSSDGYSEAIEFLGVTV